MEKSPATRRTLVLQTLDTVAMVTINLVRTFAEPQNIEQGMSK